MAFAVVHMQKIKAGAVRGIQSHINREHPPRTNPDIDESRTPDNYAILSCDNFYQQIKKAIKDFAPQTKTVRKDAVYLCNFILTSDEKTMKNMAPEIQRAFFEDATRWFCDRYGAQNVVTATVHMDEVSPHLHLGVVPIHEGRLSAKTLFDRKELTAIQTDFARDVGSRYGLERGIEGSERTHLSERALKLETAKRELAALKAEMVKAQEQAYKATQEAQRATERVQTMELRLTPLQAEYEAMRAFIQACDKESKVSELYPSEAEVKRGHFGQPDTVTVPKAVWESKWVSANEKNALQLERAELDKAIKAFAETASGEHIRTLVQTVKVLRQDLEEIKRDAQAWRRKAEKAEQDSELVTGKINRTLQRLPKDVSDAFIKAWKVPDRLQRLDREQE